MAEGEGYKYKSFALVENNYHSLVGPDINIVYEHQSLVLINEGPNILQGYQGGRSPSANQGPEKI